MNEQEALELLKRYKANQCTAEERAIVDSHYLHELDRCSVPEGEVDYAAVRANILSAFQPPRVVRRIPVYIRYAAAIITIVGITSTYYYFSNQHKSPKSTNIAKEILPGGNSATLTLGDGKEISLNSYKGKVATNPGMLVSNNPGNGVVTYTLTNSKTQGAIHNESKPDEVNAITTPKGGQYQMVLSDGSLVFLNAASKLQFFVRFAAGERKVFLSGEAYFQVAKDPKRPFIVITEGQQLQVLGTHFNVSAYPNETIKTTLAEGSIQLTSSSSLQKELLKPDQQASLLSTGIYQVKKVCAADATAWTEGLFVFSDVSFDDVLRQISRWYKVEADFSNLPDATLDAELSKSLTLSELLRSIELSSGVKIILTNEGRLKISSQKN